MKPIWKRANKRSRKVLLVMKKAMSRLLCLRREATSVRDTTKRLPTDVSTNGTQSIPATAADIGECNRNTERSGVSTSESRNRTDGNSMTVPHDADAGNELCVKEISKECASDTTDATEQCVGGDLKSNCAGQSNHTQNDDTACDLEGSNNSDCDTKISCKSCDNYGCDKEGIKKELIEGDCLIKSEKGGYSEDSSVLKKVSEIASFRKLHSDVMEKLTNLCQQWEQKTPILSIPEEQQEEVLGQIRTTVCQAQLLMRQKLKQYIDLVGQAENGGGKLPTKVEDLQGFWDMVYFQVEDIVKKFQGLEDLEKNNWKAMSELQSFPKKEKKSAALRSAKAPSTAAEISEKQFAAREKREAARLKIKELRVMAAKTKVENGSNDTGDQLSSGDFKSNEPSNALPQPELSDCDTTVPSSTDLVFKARSECGHGIRLESDPSSQISTSAPLTFEN